MSHNSLFFINYIYFSLIKLELIFKDEKDEILDFTNSIGNHVHSHCHLKCNRLTPNYLLTYIILIVKTFGTFGFKLLVHS